MSPIPTVYSEYYGCPSNRSDHEFMLGILSKQGYAISDRIEDSDVLLINTCAVKETTEARMAWRIRQLYKTGRPLIIAGCLPKVNLDRIRDVAPNFSAVLDPYSIDKVSSAIENALTGRKTVQYFRDHPIYKVRLPKIRLNKYIEVIQISEGCRGNCTYCCTRLVRRGLLSNPIEEIAGRVEKAVSEGGREVHLTAQDTGAYGFERGASIIDLLNRLLEISGKFKIRLGMMNPENAFKYADGLVEIYQKDKMYQFLHIPLQSGSEAILGHMQRNYSVEEFEATVEEFRSKVPHITLATDLIVGYPSEGEEDFERTISVIKRMRPDVVNISKYGHRPGTHASHMNLLPTRILSQRSRRLSTVCSRISLEKNLRMVGKTMEVLFTETNRRVTYIGRSDNYRKVLVKSSDSMLGSSTNVIIDDCTSRYLIGTPAM